MCSSALSSQLAFSLISTLPASHWFRRSPFARHLENSGLLDDGVTLWDHFVAHRPTPELHIGSFLQLLEEAGFGDERAVVGMRSLSGTLGGQLKALESGLEEDAPEWRWQLAELLHGNVLTHAVLVRKTAGGKDAEWAKGSCDKAGAAGWHGDQSVEWSFGERRRCFNGAWVDPLIGAPLRVGFSLGRRAEMHTRRDRARPYAPVAPLPSSTDPVRRQYEALPYPPRAPSEERRRIVRSSLASLAEVSHYAFGGRFRATFCGAPKPPFRALILGGGTGDATVQLAQEIADLAEANPGCRYERALITHVDLSASSVRIAAERLRVRGLIPSAGANARPSAPAIRLRVGNVLRLPYLAQSGQYHYINMVGVLHHVDHSRAALRRVAKAALHPNGTIGLMVYGSLGRIGIYAVQAALQLLHARGNTSGGGAEGAPEARIRDAADLLQSLPPGASWWRAPAVARSDEALGRMGGAGLFDLLLHGLDAPYTLPQLRSEAAASGLRVAALLTGKLYDWRAWLNFSEARRHPMLMERLARLSDSQAAGELLSGHVRKHWAFLRHYDASEQPAGDASLSPCPNNVSESTLAVLLKHEGRPVRWRTELQGQPMLLDLPRTTSAMVRRMDCRRQLRQVLADVRQGAASLSDAGVMDEWTRVYRELSGIGFLTMTDHLQ